MVNTLMAGYNFKVSCTNNGLIDQGYMAFTYTLLTVLLWSTIATAFKLALAELSPLQLVAWSSLVSWLFYLLLMLLKGSVKMAMIELLKKPLFYLTLGLLNPFIYFWLVFESFARLSAQLAQAINYTWPFVMTLLSVFVGKKLSRKNIVLLCLGYVGLLIAVTQGNVDFYKEVNWIGVVIGLVSTLTWAGFWILQSAVKAKPELTLFVTFTISVPLCFIALYFKEGISLPTLSGLGFSLYVGLIEMGITYWIWLNAIRLSENVARLNQWILLTPVISLFFIAKVLQESIHLTTFIGLGLLLIAILLDRLPQKRQRR
jgi:drug/metabolite transporter (DMT)-like permease